MKAVRSSLQRAFTNWGLPEKIRFDNGIPWRAGKRNPTAFSLWLVGLGIELVYGRPKQSTDNGVVERSHGVLNTWVEPEQCSDFADLEERLFMFTQVQREENPYLYGHTRSQDYPEIYHNPRHYQSVADKVIWQDHYLYSYLAKQRFHRKVESNGRITLLGAEYSLKRSYQRQTVTLRMDAQHRQWVALDDQGQEIKRWQPKNLDYSTISSMSLTGRFNTHKGNAL